MKMTNLLPCLKKKKIVFALTPSTSNPGVQFTAFPIHNPPCAPALSFLFRGTCSCFVNDDPLAKWFVKLEPRLFVVVFFFRQKSAGLVHPRVSETKSLIFFNRGPICAPCIITHLVRQFLGAHRYGPADPT